MFRAEQMWLCAGATTITAAAAIAVAAFTAMSGEQRAANDVTPMATATATPDACALISSATVSTLLETPVTSRPTLAEPGSSACTWQNASTFESVTLSIGGPGSAAELAANWQPHVPGAGTQRFLGDGALQFGASGRLITIEIANVGIYGSEADAVARVLKDSVTATLLA